MGSTAGKTGKKYPKKEKVVFHRYTIYHVYNFCKNMKRFPILASSGAGKRTGINDVKMHALSRTGGP